MDTAITPPTITIRAVCTCGHPAAHHDAGTCWTDDMGREVQDHPACQCAGWFDLCSRCDKGG